VKCGRKSDLYEQMPELLHSIAELCFETEKAQSLNAVRSNLRSAADVFGASFFLFGMRTGKRVSPPAQIIISDYPKAWQKYYDEQGAFAFDPVVNRAFQSVGAFRWDGLHYDERQLALRRESVRNGMTYGFSCSDRGPETSMAILSFCGDRPFAPEPDEWERMAASVSLLASTTNKAVSRIVENRDGRSKVFGQALSEAERKSLEMMAGAMTARQVADVLKVQPGTVRYYLDRAAEKLGVETRREAVMKALAEGIIDIRQFPNAGFGPDTELH
jgi:LuxR family transcriptional regulator, quorum-sensing system regulator LasR